MMPGLDVHVVFEQLRRRQLCDRGQLSFVTRHHRRLCYHIVVEVYVERRWKIGRVKCVRYLGPDTGK